MQTKIHPSTIVGENVKIGEGSTVQAFCMIHDQATIGDNCKIGKFVSISSGVTIGDGVVISDGVSLFDGIHVEDDVFIGPSTVFTNILNPRAYQFRSHMKLEITTLQKGCSTGANCTILSGLRIGRYSFIGAGAVVLEDTTDYSLVVGNPAHSIGWMSQEGGRLHFGIHGTAKCPISGRRYQLIDGRVSPDEF